jgi:hypothetical protein
MLTSFGAKAEERHRQLGRRYQRRGTAFQMLRFAEPTLKGFAPGKFPLPPTQRG